MEFNYQEPLVRTFPITQNQNREKLAFQCINSVMIINLIVIPALGQMTTLTYFKSTLYILKTRPELWEPL